MTDLNKNSDLQTETQTTRRQFLANTATATAAVTIAPGVLLHQVAQAKPDEQEVTDKVRWGMVIDTSKCSDGCNDCVTACDNEHGLTGFNRPETDAQWIRKVTVKDKQTGKQTSLPMLCQHCENPPCVDVCPTGASFKREDNIVLVDKHICIGCRYCMMACPYKARSFVHEILTEQKPHTPRGKGTVESCTFCVHRVDKGETPACVEACSDNEHHAMLFGDLKDKNSKISQYLQKNASRQVRADFGLNPGVRYQGI